MTPGGVSLVDVAEIERAREVIRGIVAPTPSVRAVSLGERCGRPVWLKPEHRQRTGSFKVRGAGYLMSTLAPGTDVVAASAGNHAQGVALAAARLGQHATVFMPEEASLPKVQATESYGATVRLGGATVDDAIDAATEHARRTGSVYVPPFDDRRIIAGQGTVGLEVLEEVPDVACVVVPIGGGGLCGGVAAAVKQRRSDVRVVGVMAEGAASMAASLAAGHPVDVEPMTIADGIALRRPSPLTLAHVGAFVDDLVSVDDDAVARACLSAAERAKAVVEPAGAVGLAALLEGLVPGDGPVVVVLSGGNVDPLLHGRLLEYALTASGRFLRLRLVLADRPGELARLTAKVAALHLNVVEVEHHRTGLRLPVGGVEIVLTVVTRDVDHQRSVLDSLVADGYRVEQLR